MARQKNPDTDRPRYLYEFSDKDGVLRTVEAHTSDQAVRFVYKIKVRRLTSQDAVRLYKSGADVLDATKAPDENQPELPLSQTGLSAAQGDPGAAMGDDSGAKTIVDETPAQAVNEPEPTPPKRALFGRKAG